MRWGLLITLCCLWFGCAEPPERSTSTQTSSPAQTRRRLEQMQERVQRAQALEARVERGETLSESEQAELDQVHRVRDAVQQGFEGSMDRRRRELVEQRLSERISADREYGGRAGPVQSVHIQRDGEEIRYLGHAVLANGATVEVASWSDGQNMQYDWRWPVR